MNKEFIIQGCINECKQLLADSTCIWRDVCSAIARSAAKLISAKISANFSCHTCPTSYWLFSQPFKIMLKLLPMEIAEKKKYLQELDNT